MAEVRQTSTHVVADAPEINRVRQTSTHVVVEAPNLAGVDEVGVKVLYQQPPVATVDEVGVKVLTTLTSVRGPGLYVRGDDGNWYPAAPMPWL